MPQLPHLSRCTTCGTSPSLPTSLTRGAQFQSGICKSNPPSRLNPNQSRSITDTFSRAEVFVLIITGTIPTLKPLWSRLRGKIPSLGSYVGSKPSGGRSSNHPYGNSSSGEAIRTNTSKGLKGFGSRNRPGSVTIALNEIDDLTRREAGSSSESILPKDQQARHTEGELQAQHSSASGISKDSSKGSTRDSPTLGPRPDPKVIAPSGHRIPEIRVERNFSVSYDENKGLEPVVETHYKFP